MWGGGRHVGAAVQNVDVLTRRERCEKKSWVKLSLHKTFLFSIFLLPWSGCCRATVHSGPAARLALSLRVFYSDGPLFSLVCHTSCLCSHFICPRQVHVRPLVSVLRISPDFQILVSSRFVNFFLFFFACYLCWIIDCVNLEWLQLLCSVAPFLWTPLPSPSQVLLCFNR